MAYGSLLTDVVQSSTSGTPPQFNDGSGTQVGTLCRAWVNFNGTTSPGTIRASFNVGSVTKNGTGDYTVNFTTALPDANYAPTFAVRTSGTGNWIQVIANSAAPTTTALRILVGNGVALADPDYSCVAVFR